VRTVSGRFASISGIDALPRKTACGRAEATLAQELPRGGKKTVLFLPELSPAIL
jgi:hypothetical protein